MSKCESNKAWFTAKEIADMRLLELPITESAVIRRANKEQWKYRKREGRGGGREYAIESLPDKARCQLVERPFSPPAENHSDPNCETNNNIDLVLTHWQKELLDKREAIVIKYQEALENISSKKKTEFKRRFAKRHNISRATLDRYIKAYNDGGRAALAPEWNNGKRSKIIDKEMANFIYNNYLTAYGPPIIKVWEDLCKEFEGKRTQLPTYRSLVRYIETNYSKEFQICMREPENWNRNYAAFVRRDWDKVELNEVWFGDSKQIDVACLFRGKPVFPWFTAFLEAKSRKFVGWIVTPQHDSWAIAQAYVYAVSKHGAPKTIYIDRGKDYKSKLIAGEKIKKVNNTKLFNDIESTRIPGIIRETGAEIFFSAPYNAKEKIIEPAFKVFTQRFTDLPGYRGHNIKTRPKKLIQEVKSLNLLTLDELWNKVDELINERNARPHSVTGFAPDSYWEHYTPVIPSQDLLDFLLMDVQICKVRDSSVKIGKLLYRGERLYPLFGQEVEVRRDPRNLERAVIIHAGKVRDVATLEIPDHYRSKVTMESVKRCRRINRKMREYQKLLMNNPGRDPFEIVLELEDQEKVREREIRPGISKIKGLHRKEDIAKEAAARMKEATLDFTERKPPIDRQAAILERYVRACDNLIASGAAYNYRSQETDDYYL